MSIVVPPRFEPTLDRDFRRTIGGNTADLRRVGKSGSGLSLPDFYDLARLPSIICDPSRSMVAPRQRERMSSLHPGNTHRLRRVQRPTCRPCRDIRKQVLAPDFAVAGIGDDPRLAVESLQEQPARLDRFEDGIPFSGGSSNGGFWPRKVENALSFNGD